MTNEEFKNKLTKTKDKAVKLYLIVVTVLCLWWSPFIKYTEDNGSTMLVIDFPFYSKTILFAE